MSAPLHGPWIIRPMSRRVPVKWKSWITHLCGYEPGTKHYLMADVENKRCPTCEAPIPHDIFGAWQHQNAHMIKYPGARKYL